MDKTFDPLLEIIISKGSAELILEKLKMLEPAQDVIALIRYLEASLVS